MEDDTQSKLNQVLPLKVTLSKSSALQFARNPNETRTSKRETYWALANRSSKGDIHKVVNCRKGKLEKIASNWLCLEENFPFLFPSHWKQRKKYDTILPTGPERSETKNLVDGFINKWNETMNSILGPPPPPPNQTNKLSTNWAIKKGRRRRGQRTKENLGIWRVWRESMTYWSGNDNYICALCTLTIKWTSSRLLIQQQP